MSRTPGLFTGTAHATRGIVAAASRRHEQQLVHDGRPHDVLLASGDHDAVGAAFDDLHRARGVVDRGRDAPVTVTALGREPLEPWAVGGAGGRELIGGRGERHAAGGRGRGAIARHQHVHLLAELVPRPGDAVHRMLRADLLVVAARDPVDGLAQQRMRAHIAHSLAVEPDRPAVVE